MKITVNYKNQGKKAVLHYDAYAITAGTARQELGEDDCIGNGINPNAPIITIHITGTEKATFDADHITILLDNK